ncbi:MAG: class SAM-dependent methyltransferase [Mucilaginibacter sp.]|nr:class SAM-dependent methyltransferase [Mucilaginibacter sp.]
MKSDITETITNFKPFIIAPTNISNTAGHNIYHFTVSESNIDLATVNAFGDEWTKFNFFSDKEILNIAETHYFDIVPKAYFENKHVLDVGCGTGRWTKYITMSAATVDAVDPSKAIESAAMLLTNCDNVRLSIASANDLPFDNNTFDFVFSLGVLHHIPDTQLAMKNCVEKLKQGGFFLTYLYYRFDNRGLVFKSVFYFSDIMRKVISKQPNKLKNFLCDVIAFTIYMPLIYTGTLLKKLRLLKFSKKIPLHFYIGKTFNVIKNDARDRFGTPLEQRFSKTEIKKMMENAGLADIIFSENEPYWHAIGRKI